MNRLSQHSEPPVSDQEEGAGESNYKIPNGHETKFHRKQRCDRDTQPIKAHIEDFSQPGDMIGAPGSITIEEIGNIRTQVKDPWQPEKPAFWFGKEQETSHGTHEQPPSLKSEYCPILMSVGSAFRLLGG